ncbi:MAG: hypothetical protein NT027_15120 [Proteobacteria bacterium]|nr:hypothetical protein [Pseudomonadota bacterium]
MTCNRYLRMLSLCFILLLSIQARADIGYSVDELNAIYAGNEFAANSKFKGKQTIIRGVIDNISRDAIGVPTVYLKSNSRGILSRGIACKFLKKAESQLEKLSPDQIAFLKGRLIGKAPIGGDLVAKDCELVSLKGDFKFSDIKKIKKLQGSPSAPFDLKWGMSQEDAKKLLSGKLNFTGVEAKDSANMNMVGDTIQNFEGEFAGFPSTRSQLEFSADGLISVGIEIEKRPGNTAKDTFEKVLQMITAKYGRPSKEINLQAFIWRYNSHIYLLSFNAGNDSSSWFAMEENTFLKLENAQDRNSKELQKNPKDQTNDF